MFQTTLKLVNVNDPGKGVAVIGGNTITDGVEVSDMTLDANLPGLPNSAGYNYSRMMSAGVSLLGGNTVIRRVRVINAGTQTPLFVYGETLPPSLECFPIFVGNGGENSIVEDCVVEQINPNNAREMTCITVGGTNGTIRNCLVNGRTTAGPSLTNSLKTISATALGGSPATWRITAEFDQPHNRTSANRILISVNKNGSTKNPLSGYFQVYDAPSNVLLRYDIAHDPGSIPSGVNYGASGMGGAVQGLSWVDGVVEGKGIWGEIANGRNCFFNHRFHRLRRKEKGVGCFTRGGAGNWAWGEERHDNTMNRMGGE